jgi:hypothetical protein
MDQLIASLPALLRTAGDTEEIRETAAVVAWNHVAGEGLRQQTAAIGMRQQRLIVAVADNIWRSQLERFPQFTIVNCRCCRDQLERDRHFPLAPWSHIWRGLSASAAGRGPWHDMFASVLKTQLNLAIDVAPVYTPTTSGDDFTQKMTVAARLINVEWAQHKSGVHKMFPSTVDVKDADGNALVTSYALHRPDGNWAIMLVNRDETQAHTVRVEFGASNSSTGFSGPVAVTTFGSEQYEWKADGVNSHADPDGPAVGFHVDAKPNTTFTLPKASVTVLRGNVKRTSK